MKTEHQTIKTFTPDSGTDCTTDTNTHFILNGLQVRLDHVGLADEDSVLLLILGDALLQFPDDLVDLLTLHTRGLRLVFQHLQFPSQGVHPVQHVCIAQLGGEGRGGEGRGGEERGGMGTILHYFRTNSHMYSFVHPSPLHKISPIIYGQGLLCVQPRELEIRLSYIYRRGFVHHYAKSLLYKWEGNQSCIILSKPGVEGRGGEGLSYAAY